MRTVGDFSGWHQCFGVPVSALILKIGQQKLHHVHCPVYTAMTMSDFSAHVTCCPLVSHGEYAVGTYRQTVNGRKDATPVTVILYYAFRYTRPP